MRGIEHVTLGSSEDVALKCSCPPPLAGNPERLASLQREAEVLATLNHPYIAQIYGCRTASR